METTEPRGTLGDQVAQLQGKIPLKRTDRERSVELTAMKADDLRTIAKGLGLTGYSSMKKDGLVAAIVTDEIAKGVIVVAQPDQPAAGGGENAGVSSSDTDTTANTVGNEPDRRPKTETEGDLVIFRAREIEPAILFVLGHKIMACVEHGLTRHFDTAKHKEPVLRLAALLKEKGEDAVRAFLEGFKADAWACKELTRAQAEALKNAFLGIALGMRAGLSRDDSGYLNDKLLQPFYAHNRSWGCDEHCTVHARAFALADIVREEVAARKEHAVVRRVEAVAEMADAFDLVSAVKPRTSPKTGGGTGTTPEPEIGALYDGKVVNVPEQGYGVFVEFAGGRKGLVHVTSMPGKPSRDELTQRYAPDQPVRVKLLQKNERGYGLQFEEHTSTVSPESRAIRGPYPKDGDVYLGIVARIGKWADTIVVWIDGHTGIIRTTDIGWGVPGRTDSEKAEFQGRLEKTYYAGKQIPVEAAIQTRWNNRLGKDEKMIVLMPIEPTEYARRKGGSHGQGGSASRPTTAAKPGADGDKEAERAAGPAEPLEERRETVEVDLDLVTGKPVECKQDPDSGICSVHTNGNPVTMMPGDHFCEVGRELIKQGGIPVEKEDVDKAPATDGEATKEKAEVMRRGAGKVPDLVINSVTFKALEDFLAEQEVSEDDAEVIGEIRLLISGRCTLTRDGAWAEKERMIALARKYGANEVLMDSLTRRSYGTIEQVDKDVRSAEEWAFKIRLEREGKQFVCMANGGLGGHKTPWFMEARRTNQLHPELGAILLDVIPERNPARVMAERIRQEAEAGLPLCLRCADLRLGWVERLLAENGLVRGAACNRLTDEICPPNNSGRKPKVYSFINREPSMRAYEAYEKAAADSEDRKRAADAAKDPAPTRYDDPKIARLKKVVRARSGGAFPVEHDEDKANGKGGELKPSVDPKPCTRCTQPTLRVDGVCSDCRRDARKASAKAKAAPKKEKKGGGKQKDGDKKGKKK